MTFFNGQLGWVFMRNRGRIRAAIAARYASKLRKLYTAFLLGNWSPEAASVVTVHSISLTSWRHRLPDLPLVLLSLLNQNVRPSMIHVWLTPSDYELMDRAVMDRFSAHDIRFERCDDLGPHKKWLPMIERGRDDPFVICDDDILYPKNWLEELIREDRGDAYVGMRCHRIQYDESGLPLSYARWNHDVGWDGIPSGDFFITGCGGAIIHPDRISSEFRERTAIMKRCPKADDVWLKAAHAAAGIPCYKTRFSFPCLEIPGSFETSLLQTNVDGGGNDRQIASVIHWLSR